MPCIVVFSYSLKSLLCHTFVIVGLLLKNNLHTFRLRFWWWFIHLGTLLETWKMDTN